MGQLGFDLAGVGEIDESRRNVRISDSDRQAAAERLREALDEGRLNLAEYDTRLGQAYQSVTYGDLDELFIDLPKPVPLPPAPPPTTFVPVGFVTKMAIRSTSGLALVGMILGIVALVGFWIPFADVVIAGAAVVLSAGGLRQTAGQDYAGRGMAVAGLVCGILGLIPSAIIMLGLIVALPA